MLTTLTGIGFLLSILLFVGNEAIALASKTDKEKPLTYYIRALMRKSVLVRFLLLALWIWLFGHFFFEFLGLKPW
jgi:hypothetical protein